MQGPTLTDSANDPNTIILAFAELITVIVCHFFKIQHLPFCSPTLAQSYSSQSNPLQVILDVLGLSPKCADSPYCS